MGNAHWELLCSASVRSIPSSVPGRAQLQGAAQNPRFCDTLSRGGSFPAGTNSHTAQKARGAAAHPWEQRICSLADTHSWGLTSQREAKHGQLWQMPKKPPGLAFLFFFSRVLPARQLAGRTGGGDTAWHCLSLSEGVTADRCPRSF